MGIFERWRRLFSSVQLSVQWRVSDIFHWMCLGWVEGGGKGRRLTKPYCAPSYCYRWKSSTAYSLHLKFIIISLRYWRANISCFMDMYM